MRGRWVSALTIGATVWFAVALARAATLEGGQEKGQPSTDPLHALAIEIGGEERPLSAIELVGLESPDEEEVWCAIGRPTPPLTFARAAPVVEALVALETFSRIEPRLRISASGEATLEIRLHEEPRVSAVVVRGLTEVADARVVADLLGTPRTEGDAEPPPSPPWLAQAEAEGVRPGILRGGVRGAVRRLMSDLFDAGYRMASVSGALSPDGTLTVDVDEGHIGSVRLVGPARSLWPAVEEALDLHPGRTFLEADVPAAFARVERALPFLRSERSTRPTRALPAVETTSGPAGEVLFSQREVPPAEEAGLFTVEGRVLTLYFKSKLTVRVNLTPDELLRHTPVGGIGVGVLFDMKLWDPRNRAHLRLETFTGTVDGDTLDALGKEGGEFDFALRLQVPALRLAELSFEGHGMIDTADGWRTSRPTAYLNSLLFDRPDREFYWREGSSISLTFQPTRRLLLGAEHRNDSYRSLLSLADASVVFKPDERFANPPIVDGEMGSLLFRAELFSEPVTPEQIRCVFRSPETSTVVRPRSWDLRTGYQLMTTLEVARPGLGTNARFDFTRFVGDGMLVLATGAESGLRLRGRVAGGSGLPLQKQEALGGWSALRGYEFKEFRGGDRSILAMAEYRHAFLSVFADVGSLRRLGEGWTGPSVGAGVKLHFDSLPVVGRWLKDKRLLAPLQLAAAWRLDRGGKAEPSVRLLVGHLF